MSDTPIFDALAPLPDEVDCPRCEGVGEYTDGRRDYYGNYDTYPCPVCDSAGWLTRERYELYLEMIEREEDER